MLSDQELASAPRMLHVPMALGAVVVVSNLQGVTALRLSPDVVAQIPASPAAFALGVRRRQEGARAGTRSLVANRALLPRRARGSYRARRVGREQGPTTGAACSRRHDPVARKSPPFG